jgi:hypothetical protein
MQATKQLHNQNLDILKLELSYSKLIDGIIILKKTDI